VNRPAGRERRVEVDARARARRERTGIRHWPQCPRARGGGGYPPLTFGTPRSTANSPI
jgi:hypothetical protein